MINQTVNVQVKFSITRDGVTFQDALYFSPAEYAALTQEELESMQQQRYDNWIAALNAPPEEPTEPPTEE